jgi:hypothetical protein
MTSRKNPTKLMIVTLAMYERKSGIREAKYFLIFCGVFEKTFIISCGIQSIQFH